MKSVNNHYVKQALSAAILAAFASFATQASEPAGIDKHLLAQVMTLHGLDERGAIDRLAAEEEATDLYRRIRSMNLAAYAGAWFDAEDGTLHVALNDTEHARLLTRFGAVPVMVRWSLNELSAVQANIMKDGSLVESGLLRSVHVDYQQNRVSVSTTAENIQAVRARLARYGEQVYVHEAGALPELSANVRGGDGTRNYTFEQVPWGSGYYPCSVGVSVENGFHTAGHCMEVGNDIRWAATYASLGDAKESAYPSFLHVRGDIGWVETLSGWTPMPQVNGYSDGIINVPAKWAGTNEAPINASVCRYGQTSGGPHCGTIKIKGQNLYSAGVGFIANVTEVDGSCSSDGDSGGTWISASGSQIQGTTIGRTKNNFCPGDGGPPGPNDPSPGTFFQPISNHVSNYEAAAGAVLSAHGAAAPTVTIPFGACPDMSSSGAGTFICNINPYHSQGKTTVAWGGGYIFLAGDDGAFGTCTAFQTVTVTLAITNPYGSYNKNWSFACPMGPIP